MIYIKNQQRTVSIDTKLLKKQIQKILTALEYADFDITILLTNNKTIQKYNRLYRNKDKPTDVLSFSYHPHLRPPERIIVTDPDDKNLGDLIISLEYVISDAPSWHMTWQERVHVLVVHGICHLLGYDHETDEDYKKMEKMEKILLRKIKGEMQNPCCHPRAGCCSKRKSPCHPRAVGDPEKIK